MDGQTRKQEYELDNPVDLAELRERWVRVKAAIDELLDAYHSNGDTEDDRLDDICEYFELKIDFDSPLAINE